MGSGTSKLEKNEGLALCKLRMRFIKQATERRYALSAAHLVYLQSLRSLGMALRRLAEAEALMGPSSPTSSASPSPSQFQCGSSPSPSLPMTSCVRATATAAMADPPDPHTNRPVEQGALPGPAAPPSEASSSWDFFDPAENGGDFANGQPLQSALRAEKDGSEGRRRTAAPSISEKGKNPKSSDCPSLKRFPGNAVEPVEHNLNGSSENSCSITTPLDQGDDRGSARKDDSELGTHKAEPFLSSVKAIEHLFVQAAEHGGEVSRMLEVNKVWLSRSSQEKEPVQHAPRVITRNHLTSSPSSSSSNNPLGSASKDNASDFIDEYSMISGNHSSTLERLYAWERKLHDEVEASELIRGAYDRKCDQLKREFSRGLNARVIDGTRAVAKDLHSQVRVAIHAVNSISKRIEKLRDEELQLQLLELVNGSSRMWNSMLECHRSQHCKISSDHPLKNSNASSESEPYRSALTHLLSEVNFFKSSLEKWVNAQEAYVGALNGWLQSSILPPQQRFRGRRPAVFSPRRALAPPIFVLCRDWLAAIISLPLKEVSDAIDTLISDSNGFIDQQAEEIRPTSKPRRSRTGEAEIPKKEIPSLGFLQPRLTRIFDLLTKFAEESKKIYEDIKQASEAAGAAYVNGRTRFVA
ncbi:unnamed protein product [Spirodela intermedia]|uniref:Uncharacterized protein n=1 Tax=Spirodela intermedia TaxID=51605 RepID=A0A7I8KCU2_SPIIN|nr:unnamed protein product [Spirodela intermedia]